MINPSKWDMKDCPLQWVYLNDLMEMPDPVRAPPPSDRDSERPRRRCKADSWSEEEHRNFLRGLQVIGKGDWTAISRVEEEFEREMRKKQIVCEWLSDRDEAVVPASRGNHKSREDGHGLGHGGATKGQGLELARGQPAQIIQALPANVIKPVPYRPYSQTCLLRLEPGPVQQAAITPKPPQLPVSEEDHAVALALLHMRQKQEEELQQ